MTIARTDEAAERFLRAEKRAAVQAQKLAADALATGEVAVSTSPEGEVAIVKRASAEDIPPSVYQERPRPGVVAEVVDVVKPAKGKKKKPRTTVTARPGAAPVRRRRRPRPRPAGMRLPPSRFPPGVGG